MNPVGGVVVLMSLAAAQAPTQERAIIDRVLMCIECGTERDSLDSLAIRRPAATRDSLSAALRQGPSADRRALMAARFDQDYDAVQLSLIGPPPVSRAIYVRHYVANFVASYQKRAAQGVARVARGNLVVRALLDSVIADTTYRGDVRRAARFARDSIWPPGSTGP